MVSTTFNILDRVGILQRTYTVVANFLNRTVLRRNTLNTELIADAFNAIDGFWAKHGGKNFYTDSEVRVITGVIVDSLRDNSLTATEIRVLVNYLTAKWRPDVAKTKMLIEPAKVKVDPETDANALKAVELYRQTDTTVVQPADFVALGAKAIAQKLPDNDIVNGVMSAVTGFIK